jgi:hypothetical protein
VKFSGHWHVGFHRLSIPHSTCPRSCQASVCERSRTSGPFLTERRRAEPNAAEPSRTFARFDSPSSIIDPRVFHSALHTPHSRNSTLDFGLAPLRGAPPPKGVFLRLKATFRRNPFAKTRLIQSFQPFQRGQKPPPPPPESNRTENHPHFLVGTRQRRRVR